LKGNLTPEGAEALRTSMKQIWKTYFLPADIDNDGSVVFDELLIYMKTVIKTINLASFLRRLFKY
jgi:hypothetical protein